MLEKFHYLLTLFVAFMGLVVFLKWKNKENEKTSIMPSVVVLAISFMVLVIMNKTMDKPKIEETQTTKVAELSPTEKKIGKKPEAHPWDGTYIPVRNYLKKVANDPDSLEFEGCTKLYWNDKGWYAGCNYRGKNAFGAKVLEQNWFLMRDDKVIAVDRNGKF